MRFQVLVQTSLLRELLTARGTRKLPILEMNNLMLDQITLVTERPMTHLTLIWLLARVRLQVALQMMLEVKRAIAFVRTLEQTLARMRLQMSGESLLLEKPLVTRLALERLFARVRGHVTLQSIFVLERSVTHVTRKRLLATVCLHVEGKSVFYAESCVTCVTLERSLVCVRSQMYAKVVFAVVGPLADAALVWPVFGLFEAGRHHILLLLLV